MKFLNLFNFIAILFLLFINSYSYAFTIKTFSNTVYNNSIEVMNNDIGIQNYIIEDFEDVSLVDGLTVGVENPNYGPASILPSLYKPQWKNNTWDGIYAFTSACTNGWNSWEGNSCGDHPYSQITTFNITNGTESFGIGIANFQINNSRTDLLVNGNKIITVDELTNYQDGIELRNLYLIINSDNDEKIYTVTFKIQAENSCEGLVFDHLAFYNLECNYNDSDDDGVIDQLDKCTDTPSDSWVNNQGCPANNLYTEDQMNQMVNSILAWGDLNGDNKISLIEAIKALRITSGVTEPNIKTKK